VSPWCSFAARACKGAASPLPPFGQLHVHAVEPQWRVCGAVCNAQRWGRRMEGAVERAISIIVRGWGEACVFLAARAPSLLTVRACVCAVSCVGIDSNRFRQHEQSNR
jgi:hypothetical protein